MAKEPKWADEEIEYLQAAYDVDMPVIVIAAQLDRPISGVYLKASRLGLGDSTRKKRPEVVERLRQRVRAWWKTLDRETILHIVQHSTSEETRKKIGQSLRTSEKFQQAMKSPERRQKLSDKMKDHRAAHPIQHARSRSGKREDIGFYVRSTWEANYARYLNLLKARGEIISFEYEPERFDFPDIKRGTRSYLPDFRIIWADGRIEYHEVKGYWTSQGKTAVKRFRARYPDFVLMIVDVEAYKALEILYKDQLENWE